VAIAGERLAGVVTLWPIAVGGAPALLLGPIAVDPAQRGQGLGQALARAACDAAAAAGERLILLVGEERLFAPLGFVRVEPGRVTLPGPVNPARVFVRELQPGAFERVAGPVLPAKAAAA
jgi:predicted N-acetyltransferase YhbS